MSEIPTDITTKIQEVARRFNDIPFGNSKYQNLVFAIAAQATPERAYRSLGLKLSDRLRSLANAYYDLKLAKIDEDEMTEQLSNPGTDKYEVMRIQVKLARKVTEKDQLYKLINDTVIECNYLYAEMEKFPEYTAEEFESAEELHYLISASRKMQGIVGPVETALNIAIDKEQMQIAMTDKNWSKEKAKEINKQDVLNNSKQVRLR